MIQMNYMILLSIAKPVIFVNLGIPWICIYGDSCEYSELSDFGEYSITWDSDESGDPGGFGDSGDFYEPAVSCESDDFSKTVHSVDS